MKNKMLTIALLLSTGIALPADDGGMARFTTYESGGGKPVRPESPYDVFVMKLKRLDQEKLLDFLQERFDALSLTIKEMEDFKGKKAQTSAEYKLFKKQLKDQDIYKQLISELKDLLKEYSDFFTRNGALLYYLIGSKRVTVPVEDRQNEGSKLYHPIHMGGRMLSDSQEKELQEAEATGNIQVEEELGLFDR